MPNIGGPRQPRRILLANVISSVAMYAAPIWFEASKVKSYTKHVAAARCRSCLCVISGYSTVLCAASEVLAGIPPLEQAAEERARIYGRRKSGKAPPEQIDEEERVCTLEAWQSRWESAAKGRWTHRLISNIRLWILRHHGELDFHLMKLLSGHGCFRAYLDRFHFDDSAICPVCPNVVEDAEHIITYCPRFISERALLASTVGNLLQPENIVMNAGVANEMESRCFLRQGNSRKTKTCR